VWEVIDGLERAVNNLQDALGSIETRLAALEGNQWQAWASGGGGSGFDAFALGVATADIPAGTAADAPGDGSGMATIYQTFGSGTLGSGLTGQDLWNPTNKQILTGNGFAAGRAFGVWWVLLVFDCTLLA
jgi:hypothetical protein